MLEAIDYTYLKYRPITWYVLFFRLNPPSLPFFYMIKNNYGWLTRDGDTSLVSKYSIDIPSKKEGDK